MKHVMILPLVMTFILLFTITSRGQMCGVSDSSSNAQSQAYKKITVSKDTVANLMKSVINSFHIKTDGTDTIKVAVEIDATLLAQFKDSAACYLYITRLYHEVDSIYYKEINVHIYVCHFDIIKSSTVYDETSTNLGQICTNFQNAWNAKHADIPRTVAQFLTWDPYGGGGYGIVGALGKGSVNTNAYSIAGVTAARDTTYDPLTQKYISSFTYDIYIVAHEISHNCGSHHTASCFYGGFALDTCAGPSDACLPADKGSQYIYVSNNDTFRYYYNRGSILSYCVNPGPQSPNLSFILPGDVTAGINSTIHPVPTFSIYPNPSSNNVRINGSGTFTVTISDITGRNIYTENCINKTDISISGFATGTYIVRISEGFSWTNYKLMIVR